MSRLSFSKTRVALLLLLVVVVCSCHPVDAGAVLTKKWTLYHSMGEGVDWLSRGTVSLEIGDGEKEIQLNVDNQEGCLSESALENLQSSDWYKLKLVEEGSEASVITTVSACQVRRANFRDELVLTFGRMGHVVSMAYMPLVSPLAPKTCDELPAPPTGEAKFTSRISYETAVPGMTLRTILPSYQPPPGLKMISKSKTISQTATKESPEGKKAPGKAGVLFGAEDADGQQQEQAPDVSPFSFLQRYWYILLPLMIMQFMTASQDEPKEGAAGQPAGGGAVAAPAAGVGEGTKRRGKNVK